MEKIECNSCSAVVEKELEFCSSCGDWLGLSLKDMENKDSGQGETVERTKKAPEKLLNKPLSTYGATPMPSRTEVPGIRAVVFLTFLIPFIALASYSVLNLKTVMLNNITMTSKLLSSVLNSTVKSIDNEISSLPPCPSSADEVWNNCFGLYRLSDGDIYIGEWKDDEKHGQGTYNYLQGGKYVGGWKKNQKHGHFQI